MAVAGFVVFLALAAAATAACFFFLVVAAAAAIATVMLAVIVMLAAITAATLVFVFRVCVFAHHIPLQIVPTLPARWSRIH